MTHWLTRASRPSCAVCQLLLSKCTCGPIYRVGLGGGLGGGATDEVTGIDWRSLRLRSIDWPIAQQFASSRASWLAELNWRKSKMAGHAVLGLLWLVTSVAAAWQENVRPIMYVQLGKSLAFPPHLHTFAYLLAVCRDWYFNRIRVNDSWISMTVNGCEQQLAVMKYGGHVICWLFDWCTRVDVAGLR